MIIKITSPWVFLQILSGAIKRCLIWLKEAHISSGLHIAISHYSKNCTVGIPKPTIQLVFPFSGSKSVHFQNMGMHPNDFARLLCAHASLAETRAASSAREILVPDDMVYLVPTRLPLHAVAFCNLHLTMTEAIAGTGGSSGNRGADWTACCCQGRAI